MFDFSNLNISPNIEEAFIQLATYWQEIRRGDKIPRKSDFNPMRVKPVLSEMAIMERIDKDTVVYRLAGTELTERSGTDITGINSLSTFPESVRDIINKAYDKSANKPCAGYLQAILRFADTSSYTVECLFFPLSDNEENVKYHIALQFVDDKDSYKRSKPTNFVGYEVPAIHYLDIGFGAFESEQIPEHIATFC